MSFSVLIRTHNRIEDLKLAINSVMGQKLPPEEILVLDDLNQETVKDVIKEKNKEFNTNNIFYINTKNKYNSLKNLNLNVNKCKGEFLAFLDDDDTWNEEYLKTNFKILDNYDVIYTNFYEIDNLKKEIFKITKLDFEDNILKNNGFLISNLIVKKNYFYFLKCFDHKLNSSADKDFYLKAKKSELKIYIQKIPLVNYNTSILKEKWRWSNDYLSTLPGVLMFYKKYFRQLSFLYHLKMIKKIVIFSLLSIRQVFKNDW